MVMGKDQIAGAPISRRARWGIAPDLWWSARSYDKVSACVCKTLQPECPAPSLMRLNHERCALVASFRLTLSCRRTQP